MATVINKEEAYAHLVDVVDRAMGGEEIVIAHAGEAKLRLVPVDSVPDAIGIRQSGRYAGQFQIPDEAFASLTDKELKDWGY
ncbi:type II toxin-antitoxin system Phd/YefM family antitoxin [uncultured Sphingomonas sp.]|uniref:type II toxin-antitoxin system Phd/YefM family antitoxin n=1 Tax=uncultured Sphingomonas sp. TaxID=158754 RepID=UPI0035C95985